MGRVRIDKWLWAARFFKTRSIASRSCELGRIEANGLTAKPGREVRVGDTLRIKNDTGEFVVEILQLSDIRGPAAVAQNTPGDTSRHASKFNAHSITYPLPPGFGRAAHSCAPDRIHP